jgi:hypothetical protein
VTDATTSPDDTTAPEAPGDTGGDEAEIDLDAIETDLNRVELALEQLADGTYFQDGDATASGDSSSEPAR